MKPWDSCKPKSNNSSNKLKAELEVPEVTIENLVTTHKSTPHCKKCTLCILFYGVQAVTLSSSVPIQTAQVYGTGGWGGLSSAGADVSQVTEASFCTESSGKETYTNFGNRLGFIKFHPHLEVWRVLTNLTCLKAQHNKTGDLFSFSFHQMASSCVCGWRVCIVPSWEKCFSSVIIFRCLKV